MTPLCATYLLLRRLRHRNTTTAITMATMKTVSREMITDWRKIPVNLSNFAKTAEHGSIVLLKITLKHEIDHYINGEYDMIEFYDRNIDIYCPAAEKSENFHRLKCHVISNNSPTSH